MLLGLLLLSGGREGSFRPVPARFLADPIGGFDIKGDEPADSGKKQILGGD